MAGKVEVATLMPIRNMDRAIRFYTKVLGGELKGRADGEMKDGWASVALGSHEIWLIAPPEREKRTLAYTTFLTEDIRAFVKGLKGKDVKFQKAQKFSKESKTEGPITFDDFGASAFFKDSEGNLLMAWQNMGPM